MELQLQIRLTWKFVSIALLLVTLWNCAGSASQKNPNAFVSLTDAATFVKNVPEFSIKLYTDMSWIDDDRLIFVGFKKQDAPDSAKSKGESSRDLSLPSVYIVNVKTGHTQEYVKRAHDVLCYDRDYIVYGSKKEDNGQFMFWAGKFGEEKENPALAERILNHRGRWERRCRYTDPTAKQWLNRQLYEEDGFFEVQQDGNRVTVLFHKPGVAVPVAIPDDMLQGAPGISQGFIGYYAFKRAYFAWGSQAWWLFPDGRTAPEPLVQGPWNKCYRICASFIPSAKGVLVNYHARGESRGCESSSSCRRRWGR